MREPTDSRWFRPLNRTRLPYRKVRKKGGTDATLSRKRLLNRKCVLSPFPSGFFGSRDNYGLLQTPVDFCRLPSSDLGSL
jgi:hypothetical protein